MHKQVLQKPDGRALLLYGCEPIPGDIGAPVPSNDTRQPNAHVRWHPLRGEWVAYASHRQHRTFLPPPEFNPLAPTTDPQHPTEVPPGPWSIAVFENMFPTLTLQAHDAPDLSVPTAPGKGVCEVVVFTQDSKASLGRLPLWHLELLIEVWADRYQELGAVPEVKYVYPFENRGVEVGVTLHHPHGQIYAYPFVPPIAARELEQQRGYYQQHGRGLLEELIERELAEQQRVLYAGADCVAFMPICARYSYEVWVAPRRPAPSFPMLTDPERRDLARALWDRPFPYIMAIHQAPTDDELHPEAHLHFEFYPALRMPDRLKYLAGSEIGAGVFTADTLPEQKAAELRAVDVDIDA